MALCVVSFDEILQGAAGPREQTAAREFMQGGQRMYKRPRDLVRVAAARRRALP